MLIPCRECGANIYGGASKCPQCGTEYPRGISCYVCKQDIRSSDAKSWEPISQRKISFYDCRRYTYTARFKSRDSRVGPGYHEHCIDSLLPTAIPDSIQCKWCNQMLAVAKVLHVSDMSCYHLRPCDKCASPEPIDILLCNHCEIPIVRTVHKYIRTAADDDRWGILTPPSNQYQERYGTDCWHPSCYSRYFSEHFDNQWLFGNEYFAEFDRGKLTRRICGDERLQMIYRLRCEKARREGRQHVLVERLEGPFKMLFRTVHREHFGGFANVNVSPSNLTGTEREMAERIDRLGFCSDVIKHNDGQSCTFDLVIRV